MIYNLSTKVSFIRKFYRLSLNLSKNLSFVPKPVTKSSFIIYSQKYRLSENSIVYPGNLSGTYSGLALRLGLGLGFGFGFGLGLGLG